MTSEMQDQDHLAAADSSGGSGSVDSLYALSTQGDDVAVLRAAFDLVETSFAAGDFDSVNTLLAGLDPFRLKETAALGIARATSRARDRLPAWERFVERLYEHLALTREDVAHRMRGLLNTGKKQPATEADAQC